jgi:threonine dehydrogenase-like Zn-dependent dehydrogenase
MIYGLHQAGITYGDTVVVQGAGGLGINAIAVAREMGAGNIIVIDGVEERLNMAREFGADHLISMNEHPSPAKRIKRIGELTGGKLADLVVELTGVPEAIAEGLSMTTFGGTYLVIGNVSLNTTVEIDPFNIVFFSRKIIGVAAYDKWAIPRALEFLSKNTAKYPFHRLISHKFPLEEINEAFRLAGERKVARAAIVP